MFEWLMPPDINRGLEEYDEAPQGVLIDVRTPQEYSAGHIPGSRNIPLQCIDRVHDEVGDKDVPLFAYCYSGARSRQAVNALRQMGYTHAKNIGGMAAYMGRLEA